TQLLAVLQFEGDRRLHHQIIDCLERLGREPGEAAVECIVSRHRQTIEIRELAQCASIGNPLAQFAIVPVLDAHENQRAQDLLRRQATATSLGFLQTPRQIAAALNWPCSYPFRRRLEHRQPSTYLRRFYQSRDLSAATRRRPGADGVHRSALQRAYFRACRRAWHNSAPRIRD